MDSNGFSDQEKKKLREIDDMKEALDKMFQNQPEVEKLTDDKYIMLTKAMRQQESRGNARRKGS